MYKCILTLLLIWVVTPVYAEQGYNFDLPDQSLTAKPTVELGEQVVIRVSPIKNPPPYLVQAAYSWQVLQDGKLKDPDTMQVWPDGTSVFFGAGVQPGRHFSILCAVSYLYVVRESPAENSKPVVETPAPPAPTPAPDASGKILAIATRITILTAETTAGATPIPPVPPGPGPNPDVIPDGQFKLARFAYQTTLSDVTDPTSRINGAKALATAIGGVASSIKAGAFTTQTDILNETKKANDAALNNAGVKISDWTSFFTKLQAYLVLLNHSGKLVTKDDYAQAWTELQSGLLLVK